MAKDRTLAEELLEFTTAFKELKYIPIKYLAFFDEDKELDDIITSIDLVLKSGELMHFDNDELMGVENGHFYYSSYENGLFEYSEKTGLYYEYYHGTRGEGCHVVGFKNLQLESGFPAELIIIDKIIEKRSNND